MRGLRERCLFEGIDDLLGCYDVFSQEVFKYFKGEAFELFLCFLVEVTVLAYEVDEPFLCFTVFSCESVLVL
jgi:hypothetical protein